LKEDFSLDLTDGGKMEQMMVPLDYLINNPLVMMLVGLGIAAVVVILLITGHVTESSSHRASLTVIVIFAAIAVALEMCGLFIHFFQLTPH
jgi:hypothetical protein